MKYIAHFCRERYIDIENGMIKLKSTYIEDDAIELTNGTDPACNMLNLYYKK